MRAFVVILLAVFSLVGTFGASHADRLYPEEWYQIKHCNSEGLALDYDPVEYVLPDRTRVDCLMPDRAWEYDFASKWAESGLQSMHYSIMTDRPAGIVLIVEDVKDLDHVNKLLNIIYERSLDIKVKLIYPEG